MLWERIHAIAGLSALMKCHQDSCSWTDGPPVALFRADGCWCVRYASGNWWHYSLKDRVWQDTPVVRTRSNRLSCLKGRCPLGNPPERIHK